MKTHSPARYSCNQHHAQGFVLITSTIFLVVLTLLVIYAARSAVVSERGSSNMRNRSQAFQMAELGQRWAMNQLTDVEIDSLTWTDATTYIAETTDPDLSANGCLINAACNKLQGANPAKTSTLTATAMNVHALPSFVIRKLDSLGMVDTCSFFEITTLGFGYNETSRVYLRSVVRAC